MAGSRGAGLRVTARSTAEVRLEMLEEAVEVMRTLWTGETVNHRGTSMRATTRSTSPTWPELPAMLAAYGEKVLPVLR